MSFPRRTQLDVSQPVVISGSHAITYHFQSISPGIVMKIPPGSAWESVPHWHRSSAACEGLTIPSRSDHLGPRVLFKRSLIPQTIDTRYLGRYDAKYPSSEQVLRPLERVMWKPYSDPKYGDQGHETEIRLRTMDPLSAQWIYRNVAGATLDMSTYPILPSTPALVRWIWRLLSSIPALQRCWEAILLDLQVTAILHANDFWVVRWTPKIGWLWFWKIWDGPPRWVPAFERNVSNVVSTAIMVLLTFFATKLLGMQANYDEYTLSLEVEK